MFDFVRFVAKPFMRLSETTPPNIAGTPFLRAAIRGPEAIYVPRRKQSPMRFPETSRHGAKEGEACSQTRPQAPTGSATGTNTALSRTPVAVVRRHASTRG